MQKGASLSWIINKYKPRIPTLLLMTISGAAESVLGVLFALSTRDVINAAVSGGGEPLLKEALGLAFIILGLSFSFTLFRYLEARLSALLEMDWKKDISGRILRSDYDKISACHSAQLITLMNEDVRILNEGMLTIVPGLTGMTVRIISAFAVLFSIAPLLGLLLIALGVGVIVLTGSARRYIKALNKAVTQAGGRVSGHYQEIFEKLIAVQAMSVEAEAERRGCRLMEDKYALQKKRFKISVISGSCVHAAGFISGFAALIFCAFSLASGNMSFGTLTAVTQLVAQIQAPFVNLSGFIPRYTAMTAAADRLRELEELCSCEEAETGADYGRVQEICFENVSFSYGRGGENIIEDCSFSLPEGSFTVLTGHSGIGKSTVLRLLLHIFRPSSGRIYLKTEKGELPAGRNTRRSFAYVPQGNLIFSGSIRENICLTRPDAGEEEVERASRLSCMDEFLSALPEGLDTELGENGRGLSEGQAQRLSIARALISGAPIILLDEATSALDAETEERVLKNLSSLPGRTLIAVTHRPSALKMADIQLNFENKHIHISSLRAGKAE